MYHNNLEGNMENEEQEMTLDIMEIAGIIKKRFWIITSITIAAALISGIISFCFIKPMYESKISVVINKTPTTQQSTLNNDDIMMFQNLVKTYAAIAESRTVAQNTINSLGLGKVLTLDALQKQITVTPETNTQIMDITVKDSNAVMARNKVDALSKAFINESKRIFPDGNVQTIDAATVPKKPVSPNKKLNVAIAFFLGLMLSVGLSFLMEYMDNTFKNESAVEKYVGLPVIGVIPKNIAEHR